MKLIPAIDLRCGQCVRLEKGNFDDITRYKVSPVEVAQSYEAAGAEYLHIVDLDGAKAGELQQIDTILAIKEATNLKVQVGGGISSAMIASRLLDAGISRVVIGSMAVKEVEKTQALFHEFGAEKIVLALDVNINKQGRPMVATHGWQQSSDIDLRTVLPTYGIGSVHHVLCTDISRDGMLRGPNFELYQDCQFNYPSIQFQASGGVSNLNDLLRLRDTGVSGVISGKALYEKRFTLEEAVQTIREDYVS